MQNSCCVSSTLSSAKSSTGVPSMNHPKPVFLRIKRKREEARLDVVVIEMDEHLHRPLKKKSNTHQIEDLTRTFAQLENAGSSGPLNGATTVTEPPHESPLAPQTFMFTRLDTVDVLTSKQTTRSLQQKYQAFRQHTREVSTTTSGTSSVPTTSTNLRKPPRFQAIVKSKLSNHKSTRDCRWIDVCPVIEEEEEEGQHEPGLTIQTPDPQQMPRSKTITHHRVLNPLEREMDQAIWTAFRENDFSDFFAAQEHNRHRLDFQRPEDGCSGLMAAAYHGRQDVVERLLELNAKVSGRNHHGGNAATLAQTRGHVALARALETCIDRETQHEYVYDVYCVNPEFITQTNNSESLPVVQVHSHDIQELFVQSIAAFDSAQDQDGWVWSEDELDSEDSNDENYVYNDYPDEEEISDYYDSSDDEDVRAFPRGIWHSTLKDEEENDDDDDQEEEGMLYY